MDIRKDGLYLLAKVYGNRETLRATGSVTSLLAQTLQMIREAKSGEITIKISTTPIQDQDLALIQKALEVEAGLSHLAEIDEEPIIISPELQKWMDDPKCQRFRLFNASQRQFDACDKVEYATLHKHCMEHYQAFLDNMRLRG